MTDIAAGEGYKITKVAFRKYIHCNWCARSQSCSAVIRRYKEFIKLLGLHNMDTLSVHIFVFKNKVTVN